MTANEHGAGGKEARLLWRFIVKTRNQYVHGEILKADARRNLEQKHGELNELAKTIKGYLRASIIASLRRPSKASLI